MKLSLIVFLIVMIVSPVKMKSSKPQCDDNDKEKLIVVLKKELVLNPMEGAKIINLGNCKYIVGIGITDTTSKTSSVLNRLCAVKARRAISMFINNPKITSETTLRTEQRLSDSEVNYFESYIDNIKENVSGFVKEMETLTSFYSEDGKTYIYVIYKLI